MDVMTITKCRIWVRPVNRFTAATQASRQGGGSGTGQSVCARNGDRSMYTNEANRVLTDAELDEAHGGEGNLANACMHVAMQYIQDHTNKAVPGTFGFDVLRELSPCQ
jgi:hypothetical protein